MSWRGKTQISPASRGIAWPKLPELGPCGLPDGNQPRVRAFQQQHLEQEAEKCLISTRSLSVP